MTLLVSQGNGFQSIRGLRVGLERLGAIREYWTNPLPKAMIATLSIGGTSVFGEPPSERIDSSEAYASPIEEHVMETPPRAEPAPLFPGATFRLLQKKGLTPGEAASLTAFLCGLPTSDLKWSLGQISQLLVLQRLCRLGRFGIEDGEPTKPH